MSSNTPTPLLRSATRPVMRIVDVVLQSHDALLVLGSIDCHNGIGHAIR